MWWEHLADIAYKMAADCGQSKDFFILMDELRNRTEATVPRKPVSGMSSLLGQDWHTHRKRGRDPIPRLAPFTDGDDPVGPESILVNRSSRFDTSTGGIPSLNPPLIQRTPEPDPFASTVARPSTHMMESPATIDIPKPSGPIIPSAMQTSQAVDSEGLSSDVPRRVSSTLNIRRDSRGSFRTTPSESTTPSKRGLAVSKEGNRRRRSASGDRGGSSKFKTLERPRSMANSAQRSSTSKSKKKRSSSERTKDWAVLGLGDVKVGDDGEIRYKVHWEGTWDDTWEPYKNVEHLDDDIVEVYFKSSPEVQESMRKAGHVKE